MYKIFTITGVKKIVCYTKDFVTGLKVCDQLVAHATRFSIVRLKIHV